MRVLSLGAGIQSTALALLSVDGRLPKLDHAIFSDTQWEPKAVYDHLDRLLPYLEEHGIQTHVVTRGSLREDTLGDEKFAAIPYHMASGGMGRRQCTSRYKLDPLRDKIRELLGAKVTVDDDGRVRVGRLKWGVSAEMWVGISTDEIQRVKGSDVKYLERVDPLVDILDMSRDDCITYLEERWPWPVSKSACIGCPFHSNSAWRDMHANRPDEWRDAVEYDLQIRQKDESDFRSGAYLHTSRVPLGEADIWKETMQEELTRLRGLVADDGCSPFSCHGENIHEG